ncbi:hypothetical protein F-M6_0272 [Faustovirus]|nr:hypothetical protein F-LCD7_0270 [Faustovirus]QJX72035.1 hypothetical protein F-M6_0272 [Faustovirus]
MLQLFLEALSFGVLLSIVSMIVYAIVPASTIIKAGIISFILGAGSHLVFEATGANKWYCESGHACTTD